MKDLRAKVGVGKKAKFNKTLCDSMKVITGKRPPRKCATENFSDVLAPWVVLEHFFEGVAKGNADANAFPIFAMNGF